MLLLVLFLQLPDSLPPKPAPPPSAWVALVGAYASAADTLYVYEDRGALTLLVKPSAPARLAQASESVFTFTGPRLYDAERVVFRRSEIQIGPITLRRLARVPRTADSFGSSPCDRSPSSFRSIDASHRPPRAEPFSHRISSSRPESTPRST